MVATTSTSATTCAGRSGMPRPPRTPPRRSAMVAPPSAAAAAPTTVMPICTVARKRSGWFRRVETVRARREPPSTSCCRRVPRMVKIAISAPEKTPLRSTRARIAISSIMVGRCGPRTVPSARRSTRWAREGRRRLRGSDGHRDAVQDGVFRRGVGEVARREQIVVDAGMRRRAHMASHRGQVRR